MLVAQHSPESHQGLKPVPIGRHWRAVTGIGKAKLLQRVPVFGEIADSASDDDVVGVGATAMAMRHDMVVLKPQTLKSRMLFPDVAPVPGDGIGIKPVSDLADQRVNHWQATIATAKPVTRQNSSLGLPGRMSRLAPERLRHSSGVSMRLLEKDELAGIDPS